MLRKIFSGIMLTLLLIGMLTLAFNGALVNGEFSSGFPTGRPLVYVNPQNVTASPSETFTISVKIFDVTDLYGLDIQFSLISNINEN